MQTPEGSPQQQRKRQSPITTITRKSWNNIRSKLGSKVQTSPRCKPEFLLISANVPPKRGSIPSISIAEPNVPEISDPAEQETSTKKLSTGIMQLGEPFDENAESLTQNDDISDTNSQFSFDRKPSCHYYKPARSESQVSRARTSSLNRNGSFDSWDDDSYTTSLNDRNSMELYASDFNDYDIYEDLDDLSDLEEPDQLAELIAEANLVSSDDEPMEEDLVRRRSTSSSIHRQLSQITRDDLVVTFFDETRPKRTRSTLSTPSTVWPIQE